MAQAQQRAKEKELQEHINKVNEEYGKPNAPALVRDSDREKIYEGEVPKSAESNRKPERYESLSPSPEAKPGAPQATHI